MAEETVRFSLEDLTEFDTLISAFSNVNSATFTSGKVGDALTLNGTNQRLDNSDTFFQGLTGFSFHMVAWIYLDAIDRNHGIMGQATSTYHCHIISTNKVRFRVMAGGTNRILDHTTTLSSGTWYMLSVGYDHDNTEIFIDINNSGSPQTLTTSGGAIATATDDFQLGSIQTGNYCDGQIDQFMMRTDGLFSSTELDDFYNSGSGAEFTSGNTSLLAYGGGATSSVLHKVGLSSVLSYEGAASGSLTHTLGLKALAAYEGGATGSATHSAGLIASVVANHQAGATSSVQHKSGRVSVVTHQGDTNISSTYVTGRVAVVNHEGDVSYRVLHITARQARASHEAGAIYSALTQELAVPSCIELSIEHLNKITLTIEKVS